MKWVTNQLLSGMLLQVAYICIYVYMYIVIYQLQSFLDVTVQLDVHVDVPAASSRDSSTSGGRVEALGCWTTFGRCEPLFLGKRAAEFGGPGFHFH